ALRTMVPWSNCTKDISPVLPKAFWIEFSSSPTVRAFRVEIQNSAISGWPTASLIAANISSNDREEVRLNRSTSTLLIIAVPLSLPNCVRSSLLVLKPLTERLDLRRRVRRKKVIDVDVGRGDQDRIGMCHRVEAIFAV